MFGATEGQVSPPEQAQRGSSYILKDTLAERLVVLLLFVVMSSPATQKVFFIPRPALCPSACCKGGAHNVPSLRLLKSPALHRLFILTKSFIFPASSCATLFWLGQSLSTSFLMFALIFKFLSPF